MLVKLYGESGVRCLVCELRRIVLPPLLLDQHSLELAATVDKLTSNIGEQLKRRFSLNILWKSVIDGVKEEECSPLPPYTMDHSYSQLVLIQM